MKKIFTLFAILFAMVGSMMASGGNPYAQRTVDIPSEFNGWYVYVYFYGNDIASLKSDVESYYEDDKTVLNSSLWTQDDYDYCLEYYVNQEYIPYYTQSFLGQVVNGEWVVPYGRDERAYPGKNLDPLYFQRYALIFMSNELPIAGTQWAILYSISQADEDFTDLSTHLFARGVFGGNPATANEDPQNPGEFYTTYYDGEYDFTIATPGAEVYTVSVSGDIANLDPFTEYIIPANLPVLIKSPVADLTIARCEYWSSTTTVPSNALHGGPATVAANPVYTLAAEDNEMAFYNFVGSAIPAHKAYLQLPEGTPAPRRIAFGSNATTGMTNTEATIKAEKVLRDGQFYIEREGRIYNAQGLMVK